MTVVVLISLFCGFIGGLLGSLAFFKAPPLRRVLFKPTRVVKQGPSLYVVEGKKRPRSMTEKDIWERENNILPKD